MRVGGHGLKYVLTYQIRNAQGDTVVLGDRVGEDDSLE